MVLEKSNSMFKHIARYKMLLKILLKVISYKIIKLQKYLKIKKLKRTIKELEELFMILMS